MRGVKGFKNGPCGKWGGVVNTFVVHCRVCVYIVGRENTHVIGSSKVETLFWKSLFLGNICLWESKILFHLCKLVKWII
jgi:hypothetical protein